MGENMDEKMYSEIIERLAKIEVKIDDIKGIKEKQDIQQEKISALESDAAAARAEAENLSARQAKMEKEINTVLISVITMVIAAVMRLILKA